MAINPDGFALIAPISPIFRTYSTMKILVCEKVKCKQTKKTA